ncbi:MAG: hypothetical protein A2539_02760 [Elusimicrobia bacterium RIFOXYD2_FULL_34_15]|nr:MAG: hypothetical protein A2539_02760 [Elusimicrobia bacterium RIFOXYD2_FULL_34_15]
MNKKILVIDDDETTRNICYKVLNKDYEVDIGKTNSALERLKGKKYNLIITDIKLFDLIKKSFPETVIIVFKSFGEAVNNMIDGYLTKPFTVEELRNTVKKSLEKRTILSGKKILLVDDDREVMVLYRTTFEFKGVHVESAFDGKEGLEKIRKEKPDLVILDAFLPKIDGFTLCETIKKDKTLKNTIVVLLTGAVIERKIHADLFLAKPIDPYELTSKIEELFLK